MVAGATGKLTRAEADGGARVQKNQEERERMEGSWRTVGSPWCSWEGRRSEARPEAAGIELDGGGPRLKKMEEILVFPASLHEQMEEEGEKITELLQSISTEQGVAGIDGDSKNSRS